MRSNVSLPMMSTCVAILSLLVISPALSGPSFIPPNGLSADTAIGNEKKPDGTPLATLRTLQNDVAQNSASIGILNMTSVKQSDIDTALLPYLLSADAAGLFVTQAQLGTALSDLKSSIPTNDSLGIALGAYLKTHDADLRYATLTELEEKLSAEARRATTAEAAQQAQITDIQTAKASRAELDERVAPLLGKDEAETRYATRDALVTGLEGRMSREEAARSYVSLQGGTLSGPLKGGYYAPTCYTISELKALPPPSGAALACYYDINNHSLPNLAVFALGAWHWVALGPSM